MYFDRDFMQEAKTNQDNIKLPPQAEHLWMTKGRAPMSFERSKSFRCSSVLIGCFQSLQRGAYNDHVSYQRRSVYSQCAILFLYQITFCLKAKEFSSGSWGAHTTWFAANIKFFWLASWHFSRKARSIEWTSTSCPGSPTWASDLCISSYCWVFWLVL